MKWNEMSVFQKIIRVVGFLCCISGVVFCVLEETDRMENGLNYALLLLAVSNLCDSIQNWKQRRDAAVFSLVAAVFIILCQIIF